MYFGSTDTSLRVAESVLEERRADAALAASIRASIEANGRPQRRMPRISLRLPRLELLRRRELNRTELA